MIVIMLSVFMLIVIILSVFMLSVLMLIVLMLSVLMLIVLMLSVLMVSVVVPWKNYPPGVFCSLIYGKSRASLFNHLVINCPTFNFKYLRGEKYERL